MKSWWLLVIGCLSPGLVQATDEIATIQSRIAQVPVLRGNFQQDKQVEGFRNPLRSQGNFLLAREQGVVWTTLKPFPSEMVVTRDRILSRQADGSARTELDARQQPALRSVNEMMFALLRGDVSVLSSRFVIEALPGQGERWQLRLKPRSAALAKAFEQIQLSGDRYVRDVVIREGNGDITHIQFSHINAQPAVLTDAEQLRFE